MDLGLLDYRRRVSDSYARVRANPDPESGWAAWVAERDELFATHRQSPIEDRAAFSGLPWFDYDPSWRVVGHVTPSSADDREVGHSGVGTTRFTVLGTVTFERDGSRHDLSALWLTGYGGGLFLPFRDTTNGTRTYGGGRYLLDTVKGADLGQVAPDDLVLDFNFAYHPSCVHSDRWSCPLAPPDNQLDVAVDVGERFGDDPHEDAEDLVGDGSGDGDRQDGLG